MLTVDQCKEIAAALRSLRNRLEIAKTALHDPSDRADAKEHIEDVMALVVAVEAHAADMDRLTGDYVAQDVTLMVGDRSMGGFTCYFPALKPDH
jgi:hypothetical protein